MDKKPRSRRKKKNNVHKKIIVIIMGVLIALGIAGGIILNVKGIEDGKTSGELTSEATPSEAMPGGTDGDCQYRTAECANGAYHGIPDMDAKLSGGTVSCSEPDGWLGTD